jgi:hypothetical protein
MGYIKIDISDGEVVDQSTDVPMGQGRLPLEYHDTERPDLQIVENTPTPGRGGEVIPPFMIIPEKPQIIESTRKRIGDLPN